MQQIISVSEFNTSIKSYIQELGLFRVKGEVTELRISPNKGLFLTISDGKSNLSVGGYAPTVKGLDLIEKDMEIVVTGTPDIYVPYGKFSLAAVSVEPFGEGALGVAYQKLKEKLEKKGMFDDIHKLPLPRFITKIALLTAKNSAAYSDFTKILKENGTGIEVDFFSIIVQGEASVSDILKKIELAKSNEYDAIVLTRGGGSLEDLKGFNDEKIADEIFTSKIPIVVGVGHEKDESIADFVADIRASTPSQCAYYILSQNEKFLDDTEKMVSKIENSIKEKLIKLQGGLDTILIEIYSKINGKIENLKQKLVSIDRLIDSYDVSKVLKRGFALLQMKNNKINNAKETKKGDNLEVIMHDGVIETVVSEIRII